MEGEQDSSAAASSSSPEAAGPTAADGAALSDSFSQLWSDVMGMLVSLFVLPSSSLAAWGL